MVTLRIAIQTLVTRMCWWHYPTPTKEQSHSRPTPTQMSQTSTTHQILSTKSLPIPAFQSRISSRWSKKTPRCRLYRCSNPRTTSGRPSQRGRRRTRHWKSSRNGVGTGWKRGIVGKLWINQSSRSQNWCWNRLNSTFQILILPKIGLWGRW